MFIHHSIKFIMVVFCFVFYFWYKSCIICFHNETNVGSSAWCLSLKLCETCKGNRNDSSDKHTARVTIVISLVLGRGDNSQLFISPLLKYEGWFYIVMDDKKWFGINSQEPPAQGIWKVPIPPEPCRKCENPGRKYEHLNFILIVV